MPLSMCGNVKKRNRAVVAPVHLHLTDVVGFNWMKGWAWYAIETEKLWAETTFSKNYLNTHALWLLYKQRLLSANVVRFGANMVLTADLMLCKQCSLWCKHDCHWWLGSQVPKAGVPGIEARTHTNTNRRTRGTCKHTYRRTHTHTHTQRRTQMHLHIHRCLGMLKTRSCWAGMMPWCVSSKMSLANWSTGSPCMKVGGFGFWL